MPKQILDTDLEAIRRIVSRFPLSVAIGEISDGLDGKIQLRTLQRYLKLLAERGEVVKRGSGRATRYQAPVVSVLPLTGKPILNVRDDAERYVTLSDEAEEIKQYVRQAIQLRKPVGYNQAFLATYQPNRSFYLSTQIRDSLRQLGGGQVDDLPAGTYIKRLYNRLLIDLSWNSSRLEGNTYSLLETERLIEQGESAEGKDVLETQMILNHKAAIELLVDSAGDTDFNHYTLCNLHALLADNLLAEPAACGRLRERSIGIGGSVFHPLAGGSLVQRSFDDMLGKARIIQDPFEQAFFIMVQLPYLQPFEDVNKRVSRLTANISLIKSNLSPLSFVDVPERAYIDGLLGIYELNRTELLRDVFVWAYERSCVRYSAARQSLGEPDLFRFRNREKIARLMAAVVVGRMDKKATISTIREFAAKEIYENDQPKFIEVIETELMDLHEGNISRFRIRPSQFEEWKQGWR